MHSILDIAPAGLTVAAALTALALICDLVIATASAKRPVPAEVPSGDGAPEAARTASDRPMRAKGGTLAAYATGLTVAAWLVLTAYLVVRTIGTGHGPFANQHEFAVAFTWGIMAAYLLVEWRFQLRILSVVALPVALALLAYGMRLDTEVVPLVPALQNSTLLTLHVGFAVAAYGAACVSFAGAACYLLYNKLRFLRAKDIEVYDIVGYKSAVVTFPLLTTMIVLGALWADTAWGRYWGWDPKETAALVTWLIYGAFLHARIARGWRGKKSAWLLIIGFAAVLFAYFGNHFLGGLHSYA
ncbi:MAG: c-type cytochrome biogenesis protein CcsB [Bifidobacteriaceae bacterium]|jgi:cytochrome c-type biogenesis protein CcsB|nr:c-type cytochrome biogenesis protein CcsB [Bifidobacteriaceae bacterium]